MFKCAPILFSIKKYVGFSIFIVIISSVHKVLHKTLKQYFKFIYLRVKTFRNIELE